MLRLSYLFKIIIPFIINVFLIYFPLQAQNLPPIEEKTEVRNNFYLALHLSAGANTWQVRESQFNMLFPLSQTDFINSTTSLSAYTFAPHLALGAEFGNPQKYFGGFNLQFTFGGMIGSYFDICAGINIPLSTNRKVLLQLGSGIFYQIISKELDRRRLQQSISLKGKFFNNTHTFTTDLIDENFGLRPFIALRFPIGRVAHLRIAGGHQFNFISSTRIRFSQSRPSGGRRNTSSTTSARFYTDDSLFDFQYNNQKISRTPFDYNGFFANIGIIWVI